MIIATREAFYHLNFRRDVVDEHFDQHGNSSEDGVEEAFILEAEIQEVVRSGQWVGDCFLYVSKSGRLNYSVGKYIQNANESCSYRFLYDSFLFQICCIILFTYLFHCKTPKQVHFSNVIQYIVNLLYFFFFSFRWTNNDVVAFRSQNVYVGICWT